ncbi:MAG: hypothetical protein FGF51_05760 [Candidatus Brockarchaeota archaeon]|nr:hypothetical protein [Candidatus Brockarchaeota archaeon]
MSSVRQRFIESIEYLRQLGFFEDYSNLTSEEIFEKIREGSILLKNLREEDWAKESTYEIDSLLATYDRKRIWGRDIELGCHPTSDEEVEFLKELAQISRGAFQPTDIEWRKEHYHGCGVYFTFNGKRHVVRFSYSHGGDFLEIGELLYQINEIIKDTGYSYYLLGGSGQFAFVVVLSKEEKEKLVKERNWKLFTPRK